MPVVETAFFFGHDHPLFGIVSESDLSAASSTAVVLLNSGLVHRSGPFRMGVEIARALAEQGFPVLRFDQSSRGDSARRNGVGVEEAAQLDVSLAIEALRDHTGVENIVLAGLCSGADDVVRFAASSAQVNGMILLDPYAVKTIRYKLRHLLPRVLNPARVLRFIRRRLGILASRNGKIAVAGMGNIRKFPSHAQAVASFQHVCKDGAALCVFTSGVGDYYNYAGQLVRGLGLQAVGKNLEEVHFDTAEHTYPLKFQREKLVRSIVDFCQRRFGN